HKFSQIVHDLITHGNKCITFFQKISCKGTIPRPMFVRNNIVRNANDFCMLVSSYSFQDRSQCGPHKRDPVTDNDNVGSLVTDPIPDLYPVQWVDGIDNRKNFEILWFRFM